MQLPSLSVLAVLFVVISILIIILLLRKLENKNNVINIDRSSMNWDAYKCPKCRSIMEQGFSFSPRGVVWTQNNDKTPGAFTTINQSLENTLSMRFSPAVNKAWKCKTCKMLVMDYSQMLKIKGA